MFPEPVSPYGMHKLIGEQYGEMYSRLYALDITCFRYFNVFGPRQDVRSHYSGVISIFIDTVLSDGNPVIYGDGCQSRDFVHVNDVCQANLLALTENISGFNLFNVGSGSSYSLIDLLDCIREYTGKDFKAEYRPDRRGDLRHSVADISVIQKKLGFQPKIPFKEGLKDLVGYARACKFRPKFDSHGEPLNFMPENVPVIQNPRASQIN
jgi:nucleoside-diphosphate-sugar epimerase